MVRTTHHLIWVLLTFSTLVLTNPLHPSFAAQHTGDFASGKVHSGSILPAIGRYRPLSNFRMSGLDGPYRTQGNLILGSDNQPYLFHGLGRDSLEFRCLGDGHFDAQELSYMGPGKKTPYATYWSANTVRLPLSEGFWLYGDAGQHCTPAQYQRLVQQVVDSLTALNLNVIIDLQWTDGGGQVGGGGAALQMPDADSVTFWQRLATTYARYSNVLFELFNEPHPATWSCWRNGCSITNDGGLNYQAVGMQTLLTTVRKTGATNLALIGGMSWGFDLSQVPTYLLNGSNVVYDTHPYPYATKMPQYWDVSFGKLSATYPVISAESGTYDCGTGYTSLLLAYFDAHNIGWMGWAWAALGSPCRYPQVITSYNGTPTPGMGQVIYQHLQSYLVPPVSSPGNPQARKA
jgi:endoglucanase